MAFAECKQPEPISLKVSAKVNLCLHAGQLGDDGYHDITMVYQAVSLYDTLTISFPQEAPQGLTMTVTGMDSDRIPSDERNLVIQAARLLANHCGIADPHLRFDLIKAIPTEAGLGGGSADAAAALVGCDMLWKTGLSKDQLMAVGAQVGEDVPFFIWGLVAINIGHQRPLLLMEVGPQSIGTWHWVLGILPTGLSTRDVFARFSQVIPGRNSCSTELAQAARCQETEIEKCLQTDWVHVPPQTLVSQLVNNLEEPAMELMPEIRTALQEGEAAGAVASVMAGSGSTCLYLASNEDHAKSLAVALGDRKLFREIVTAHGPVEAIQGLV
ncbi:4-diphosphocytidyl-2-C-methyl-D-erythritol kinase [Aspergillus pseudoustus]|uniref:4-(cytidine 5'-diphospho)-2-C-methyl-D-erythritol kinase n=1 Tax=Aspergillus pseudoustus TaxID=1810923 RepID=A0ABR4JLG5_9EURO